MSKLISIEGADGTGKTTQSLALVNNLKKHKKNAILAREPGGTNIGEILRNILKNEKNIEPISELLLFQAARTELIEKVIFPALKSNKIVSLDPGCFSELAALKALSLTKNRLSRFPRGEIMPNLKLLELNKKFFYLGSGFWVFAEDSICNHQNGQS